MHRILDLTHGPHHGLISQALCGARSLLRPRGAFLGRALSDARSCDVRALSGSSRAGCRSAKPTPRRCRSRTRGWLHSTTPWALVPLPLIDFSKTRTSSRRVHSGLISIAPRHRSAARSRGMRPLGRPNPRGSQSYDIVCLGLCSRPDKNRDGSGMLTCKRQWRRRVWTVPATDHG
jgi:hypothetical protein